MASLPAISLLSFGLVLSFSASAAVDRSPDDGGPFWTLQLDRSVSSFAPTRSPSAGEAPGPGPPAAGMLQQACKAARLPDVCISSFAGASIPPGASAVDIILAGLSLSGQKVKSALSKVAAVVAASAKSPGRSGVAKDCIEHLCYSGLRLGHAAAAISSSRIKDARAWSSSAVGYHSSCYSGLTAVNGTEEVDDAVRFLLSLTQLSCSVVWMIAAYDRFGGNISAWAPPQTERDGYWEVGGGAAAGGSFRGGFPSHLPAPNAVVCKDGDGRRCYRTVQEAVRAAPTYGAKRFVIHIREGVYNETVRIPFHQTNVVFLGDGIGKTIITGALSVRMVGVTTYGTATVGVNGDGFMAKGLTFENTAGPESNQAVAFRSDSDRSVLEEVEFRGYQDTLYAHSLRQFYKSCRILGTVDFIFGNAAAVFQDCRILVLPRPQSPRQAGVTNTVAAHGRTDPAETSGFVFRGCTVNGTEEYMALYRRNPGKHRSYLGRPWKEFSRAVFVGCYLEALIHGDGWLPWSGDFGLRTLFFGEFNSSGPGAEPAGRVPWSNQIPAAHVGMYSVENFIQGDRWMSGS